MRIILIRNCFESYSNDTLQYDHEYGVVYVTNAVDMAGNGALNGAANYNASIVSQLMNTANPGFSGYSKVSGSGEIFNPLNI